MNLCLNPEYSILPEGFFSIPVGESTREIIEAVSFLLEIEKSTPSGQLRCGNSFLCHLTWWLNQCSQKKLVLKTVKDIFEKTESNRFAREQLGS